MRVGIGILLVSLSILGAPAVAGAQESRLVGRVPDDARQTVDSILNTARASGLPTEPLVDRALEGAAKGASGALIVRAVTRLHDDLHLARLAFGESATAAELTAGASALRAGASRENLSELRALRPNQSLTVAAAVLADLVAVGVPTDTAVAAVLALARDAEDADYIAFRRNVQRDIALGASPAAALGVRLETADELAGEAPTPGTGIGTPGGPRKRKP